MPDEFERLLAQFEEFQSKIQHVDDQFGNIEGMQAELTNIEASATSNDRSVTITAGPGGAITNIQFTEDALKQRPDVLSSAVLATLQQAVADSARQQAALVDQHMGGNGFNATDQVLETQAQLFGTSPEQLRAQMAEAAPAPPRTGAEEVHDDYSQQSVLSSADKSRPSQPEPPRQESSSAGDEFLKNLFNDDDDYR